MFPGREGGPRLVSTDSHPPSVGIVNPPALLSCPVCVLSERQAGQRTVAGTVGGILQRAQELPTTAAAGIRPQSYFMCTAVAPTIWERTAGILTPPNLEPREGCFGSLWSPIPFSPGGPASSLGCHLWKPDSKMAPMIIASWYWCTTSSPPTPSHGQPVSPIEYGGSGDV